MSQTSFSLHPAFHLPWYSQPFGNSWGQDWATYELNQPLLSPRPLQFPVLCPAASCPLVPLYIHLFLLFNFYFYFFYY